MKATKNYWRRIVLLSLFMMVIQAEAQISIIPKPSSVRVNSGEFVMNAETRILYANQDGYEEEAKTLQQTLARATGFTLPVSVITTQLSCTNCIQLVNNLPGCDTLGNEGYYLNTDPSGVVICAPTTAGIFYGTQSLRQLLPREIEDSTVQKGIVWRIPSVHIIDKPAFVWRGMLLDCCRHFMSKKFVMRYIDLLAYYKMNRFHWHLTEDQGWRIEIKKYPKLTQIGSWRKEADGTVYGGYYTQDEIREVVAYAAKRHVMVIPEIEMPGHSLAALASYPNLGCTGGPYKVERRWGVFKDIYCAGNDSTFAFLQNVLNEVISLFPSSYIHIGGDEAPHYRWETCKKCLDRMKKNGLKDGAELQSYFITRIGKYLNSKGKQIIGWDEIMDGGLAPGATVQSWRGLEGALQAASAGHDAIVSPTSHAYFDAPIGSLTIDKVYDFDPVPEGLDPAKRKHILGGECNMWTEHAPQEMIDNKMFPRLLAMTEVLWSYPQQRDRVEFLERVSKAYPRLDLMGVKYGNERQPVTFSSGFNEIDRTFLVSMTPGQKDNQIVYTTDGSDPTLKSSVYTAPFVLKGSGTVKARLCRGYGLDPEIFSRTFVMHTGVGLPITLTEPYSKTYTGGGPNALVDGVRASSSYKDGLWQGYQKIDMEATIALGDLRKISKVTVGFLQNIPSWIFLPEFVELSVSDNGKDFKAISQQSKIDQSLDDVARIQDYVFANLGDIQARYIRIRAKNIGYCPDWHDGAGGEAWIFCDEIIIE
jgi:hexosaminidase